MSVEDLLRAALHDERHQLPGWPDATVRVRAGMSRRRRRRAVSAIAALAVAAALAVPIAVSVLSGHFLRASPAGQPFASAAAPSPGQVVPWPSRPDEGVPVSFDGQPSSQLRASIDAPSSADPGADLVYVVVLENRSDRSVRLDAPCPTFVQKLGTAGGAYLLNCVVPVLPAGSWLRLQMRLAVPVTAPAGAATLSWTISIDGEVTSAVANVTVR